MSVINCCKGGIAPKRHTACWDHCPEYQKEKAEYEKRKAEADAKRQANNEIWLQKAEGIARASRKRGSRYNRRNWYSD